MAFIGGVLSGKTTIAPFKEFPLVSEEEDCAALYAASAVPAVTDEFDLNDILGYVQRNGERGECVCACVCVCVCVYLTMSV